MAMPEQILEKIIQLKLMQEFQSNLMEKIYYRFLADGKTSDIGMTSTLPSKNPNNFNIAFAAAQISRRIF